MTDDELLSAVNSLNAGLCVVYPTSTLPGLGCKPTKKGLDKLYSIKNRDENMPVSLGVFDMNQVEDLVYFNQEVIDLLSSFAKGSITLILPAKETLDDRLGGDNIAIRVFSNPKASELARLAGPISATSANKSGVNPQADCEKAGQELGLPTDCIVSGFCESGLGSTFVKVDLNENCTGIDTVTVMRQGVVPSKDVKAWLMSKTE